MDKWRELTKLKWVKYPDVHPTEAGYYYTYYLNEEDGNQYFKCIFWNMKQWLGWRQSGGPKLTVMEYAPSTREDYYTMCMVHQREDERNG